MTHKHHESSYGIRTIPEARVREVLASGASYVQLNADGKSKQVLPPTQIIKSVFARGYFEIPQISCVSRIPLLVGPGKILSTPGYDPDSKVLYLPNHGPLTIPENPSHADAVAAAHRLFDPVQDFPFAGEADKAAWLAGLLTLFARHIIAGPTPFFLVMSNIRSAGKGLLGDVIGNIVLGCSTPKLPHTTDQKEEAQQIFSVALEGLQIVFLDNIEGKVGSPAFNSMLTATAVQGRVYYTQQLCSAPMNAVWFGSGNNLILHADLARRTVVILLKSNLERPELRTDFKYLDLMGHLRANRESLIADALTILKAFGLANVPRQLSKGMGSYEDWDRQVRETVFWTLGIDPCERTIQGECQHDSERAALEVIVRTWLDEFPNGGGHHTTTLAERVTEDGGEFAGFLHAVRELSTKADGDDGGSKTLARTLGYLLRRYMDRPILGHRFVQQGTKDRYGVKWELVPVDGTMKPERDVWAVPAGTHPSASATDGPTASSFDEEERQMALELDRKFLPKFMGKDPFVCSTSGFKDD